MIVHPADGPVSFLHNTTLMTIGDAIWKIFRVCLYLLIAAASLKSAIDKEFGAYSWIGYVSAVIVLIPMLEVLKEGRKKKVDFIDSYSKKEIIETLEWLGFKRV